MARSLRLGAEHRDREAPKAARREDIPDLARAFVRFFTGRVKKHLTGLTAESLAALASYGYPGNVRELRNIIERAVILARGPEVTPRELILPETGRPAPPAAADGAFFRLGPGPDDSPPTLEEVERAYVARVLQYVQGRRMAAAEALGISYPTFLKRLRELGLE